MQSKNYVSFKTTRKGTQKQATTNVDTNRQRLVCTEASNCTTADTDRQRLRTYNKAYFFKGKKRVLRLARGEIFILH